MGKNLKNTGFSSPVNCHHHFNNYLLELRLVFFVTVNHNNSKQLKHREAWEMYQTVSC